MRVLRAAVALFTRILTGTHVFSQAAFPSAPFVVIANHSSHWDTMVIWACLPHTLRDLVRPVAGGDYWGTNKIRRWFLTEVLRGVMVPRGGVNRSNHPIAGLASVLEQGECLLLFPEGTRSTSNELSEFKSGLYYLIAACSFSVEILPVGLVNLQRIAPKGESVPVPLICSVRIGAPLKDIALMSKKEALAYCKSSLENLLRGSS